MSKSEVTFPEILKPRFGLFSYVSGPAATENPEAPQPLAKKKTFLKRKSPKFNKTQKINKTLNSYQETSFTSLENTISHELITTSKDDALKILRLHSKQFKPPGPYKEKIYPFHYFPDSQKSPSPKSKLKKPKSLKNFLLPPKKPFFSTFKYISEPSPKPSPPDTKRKKSQRKKKPKIFKTVVKTEEYFNPDSSIYGIDRNKSLPQINSSFVRLDPVKKKKKSPNPSQKPKPKPKKNISDVFSLFEHLSEKEFPAKTVFSSSSNKNLHKFGFKPATSGQSYVSPPISTSFFNLKREFHIKT